MKFIILIVLIFAGIFNNALRINNELSANGKILGGGVANLANTMSVPFLAAVSHPTVGFLCTGVIVKVDRVLTTADCVYAYSFESPVQVYVEIGGVILSAIEAGKQVIPLSKIIIHPDFHSREMIYYNNLALMKTLYVIKPDAYIAPIALPIASAAIPAGTAGSLVGWGGTSNSNPVVNAQIAVTNVVLDMKECQRISGMVLEKEFCTDPQVSASACKYDHGSPLFEYDAVKGSILLGIVNYAPCIPSIFPTIYTNIPDYVDWIEYTP